MEELSHLDQPHEDKSRPVFVHTPPVHHILPRHEVRARRRREVRNLPNAGVIATSTRPIHPVPNRKTITDPASV